MSKIGFFGGSFNPPTNIHINMATDLVKNKILDKVIFVPVGDYYEKKNLIDSKYRVDMLKIATEGIDNLEVDDIEMTISKKLYATDIFDLLSKKYCAEDIYFIMGSDNYENMPKWKNYDEIKDKYKYIIVKRSDNTEIEQKENIIIFDPKEKSTIDSTTVRNMIQNGESAGKYLNKKVYEYIEKNHLYKY